MLRPIYTGCKATTKQKMIFISRTHKIFAGSSTLVYYRILYIASFMVKTKKKAFTLGIHKFLQVCGVTFYYCFLHISLFIDIYKRPSDQKIFWGTHRLRSKAPAHRSASMLCRFVIKRLTIASLSHKKFL